jgi:hypothetical protein
MKSALKFPLAFSLLFCSCEDRKGVNSFEVDNAKPGTTYFSHKPRNYFYTYDTSKNEIENFSSGYVDTFSVAWTNFQLLSNPDTLGDLELQVMRNGKWRTNLKLGYGINGNEAATDVNQDGFNDFVSSLLRGNAVYLFDSARKEFHSEPVSFAFEWAVIDSTQKLYSNNYSGHDYYETDLFKLDGFQQTFFYTAPIEYFIGDNEETITLKLYKVRNNSFEDTTFLFQKKFNMLRSEFNYEQFWTKLLKEQGYR